jgi:AraC family transcriptional activator of pobA
MSVKIKEIHNMHHLQKIPPEMEQIQCRYLYHQYRVAGESHRGDAHAHPFWQIDFISKGHGYFSCEEQEQPFEAGDFVIVPKEVRHAFVYPGKKCEWLSLKFSVKGFSQSLRPQVFKPNSITSPAVQIVRDILPQEQLPDGRMLVILNSTLKIFVQYFLLNSDVLNSVHSEFLAKIFEYVASCNGKYVTIDELAEQVGYSAKYTSNRFRREAGCPLKYFLDQQRFNHAQKMLCFTGESVSDIAGQLDFSDMYAFSRFFKRWAGQSPTSFRENKLKGL